MTGQLKRIGRSDAVAPVLVLSAVIAIGAIMLHRWQVLACVAGTAPVAMLLLWAMNTAASARAGRPVQPLAYVTAMAVELVAVVVAVALCVLAVVAPELVGLTGGV